MKFKKLLISLGLAAAVGLGVGTGLSLHTETKMAKADSVSGTVSVDLTGGDWAANEGGQNISVYFFNSATDGWGSYETAAKNEYVAFVDYDLDFVPTGMIAVRYSNWYAKSTWETDPWASEDGNKWGKWNQTTNLDFEANGNIIIGDWNESESKNDAYVNFPYIHGQNSETSWSWTTIASLDSVKLNGSNHIEYYKELTLPSGYNEFGIKILSTWSDWFGGSVTTISDFAADGNWDISGSNIIRANESDSITIRLYFDRNNGSIYITEPTAADADEWAQAFLGVSESSNTCTFTKANWTASGTSYSSLSSGAKAILSGQTHVDHDAPTSSYAAAAVQRYDYVIERYGVGSYADFMGRINSGALVLSGRVSNPISFIIDSESNIAFIAIVSVVSITIIGAASYFLLRKKKHN